MKWFTVSETASSWNLCMVPSRNLKNGSKTDAVVTVKHRGFSKSALLSGLYSHSLLIVRTVWANLILRSKGLSCKVVYWVNPPRPPPLLHSLDSPDHSTSPYSWATSCDAHLRRDREYASVKGGLRCSQHHKRSVIQWLTFFRLVTISSIVFSARAQSSQMDAHTNTACSR